MFNFGIILNCFMKVIFKNLNKNVYSLLYSSIILLLYSNLFLLRCFQNGCFHIAYAYIFLKPLLNYSFSKFIFMLS